MSDKPEVLRLADALEMSSNHGSRRKAAAELRRLHDLVYTYKWQVRDTCARAEKAEAQRDELRAVLAAAETLSEQAEEYEFDDGLGRGAVQIYWDELENAIVKAIGETP